MLGGYEITFKTCPVIMAPHNSSVGFIFLHCLVFINYSISRPPIVSRNKAYTVLCVTSKL